MTTNNHIDRELGEAQLDEQDLDQVTGGVIITKHVDKASPSLMLSGGGTPSLEYWLQQLMF
jgi:type VI protein secretion system component Hcp